MELKVNEIQLPESLTFNYEELKKELTEKAAFYTNIVFTSDQMQDAKKDRAELNKLKKALNDERIRQEKEYMKPFNDFKSKVNEIIKIIDEPVKAIDSQIKTFEEQKKAEKLEAVKDAFADIKRAFSEVNQTDLEWLSFEQIFDSKWLNASVSMLKVQEEIKDRISHIDSDVDVLSTLQVASFEIIEMYKQTLDMHKAISEGQRLADIQKRKAEAEAKEAEQEAPKAEVIGTANNAGVVEAAYDVDAEITPEPEDKSWTRFEAFMTTDQALMLIKFFEANNISFRAI